MLPFPEEASQMFREIRNGGFLLLRLLCQLCDLPVCLVFRSDLPLSFQGSYESPPKRYVTYYT